MKKIFFAFLLVISVCSCVYSDNEVPAVQRSSLDSIHKSLDSVIARQSKMLIVIDSLKFANDSLKKEFSLMQKTKLSAFDLWLIFSPLLLFIVLMLITKLTLNKEGWSLKDALSSDLPTKLTKTDANNPQNNQTTEILTNSSSRVVLFLSGMTTLIITVCLVSYYIYFNIVNRGKTIDYSDLSSVLLALGLGVIPYAANKFANAVDNRNR